jgi:plasmid stabilization system protein ParE
MTDRYVLAPKAALDLIEIWRYIDQEASRETADRVEATILEKIAFLSATPGAGHQRKDLTDESVKFFPVYSYLIVYQPGSSPLRIVAILHGSRDVAQILKGH